MDMLEICNSGMWPTEQVPTLCRAPSTKAPGSKCPDGSICPANGVCPHQSAAEGDYGWMRSQDRSGAKPLHPEQSWAEYRSQFSTFAILTSPLVLGNDPRNMSKACLDIIANKEIIALNQDGLVSRATLVHQSPMAEWPNVSWVPPSSIWPANPDHPTQEPRMLNTKGASSFNDCI